MKGALIFFLLLAINAELVFSQIPDEKDLSFSVKTISMGQGRPVCAYISYDPVKAANNGLIFVTESGAAGDEEALRLSAAVISKRAGLLSRAAIVTRRYHVTAVGVGLGLWSDTGPSLILRKSILGPPVLYKGVPMRSMIGAKDITLKEGEAVCIDPQGSKITLLSSQSAELKITAAQAARTYDGLKDAFAIEHWLQFSPNIEKSIYMMSEFAPRVLDGTVNAADMARIEKSAEMSAGKDLDRFKKMTNRIWKETLPLVRQSLEACVQSIGDAPSTQVTERLSHYASAMKSRIEMGSKIYSSGDEGLVLLAQKCITQANQKSKSLPRNTATLEQAAVAAGAERFEGVMLPSDSWKQFLNSNSLNEEFERTISDASLGLKRKSERLRAKILQGQIDNSSTLNKFLSHTVTGPGLIIGENTSVPVTEAKEAINAVREVWAADWGPGPLGARLRVGLGSTFSGRINFVKKSNADFSGIILTRDAISKQRHATIEVSPGSIEQLLNGKALTDQYTVDLNSGRILESLIADDDRKVLSSAQLKSLTRLARALDAWQGSGMEIAFSMSGNKLNVHHASAMAEEQSLNLSDQKTITSPTSQYLNLKTVH